MTHQKVSIYFYSWPQNSEKSTNNRFQAKPVKYSNFYDIVADVWPILMKFCIMTHISYPEHNSCSKVIFKKKFKMVDAAVVKCDISAIVSLILIKLGATITTNSIPGHCFHKNMRTQKLLICFYVLRHNSAKSANKHLHAKAWNIETFTISLLLFDQFWWNFARQSLFGFPSWWVTKSLRILKSWLTDVSHHEN